VLAAHADTIAVASLPLSAQEANVARAALAQVQHALSSALIAVLPGDRQHALAQLSALVRSASPYGDKTQHTLGTTSLPALAAQLKPFLLAAARLAETAPPDATSFTTLLERAGVSAPRVPSTVDKAIAQTWLSEIIANKPTLRSLASREAAWRLLGPIISNDASCAASDLAARTQALASTVLLRPDGYFASLATGDAVAKCEDERVHVGRTYTLHAGVVLEGERVVTEVKPLDDRLLLRAAVGAGRSVDQMFEGMANALQHPVDTLGPVLPNIAKLIVSSPAFVERFAALPPAEQADALGGVAMNVGLFLLGGRAAGTTATSAHTLPLLTLDAHGALALATEATTLATQEAAVTALTLHLAEVIEQKRPRSVDMKHIAQGEVVTSSAKVNGKWKKLRVAKGFHLERATDNARIVRGTETPPNSKGIYRGRVEILDTKSGQWAAKEKASTFFPKHYTEADVLRAIEEAYSNASVKRGKFIGESKEGISIQFYVKDAGDVASAFPLMETL
jgi:hypothetical protein